MNITLIRHPIDEMSRLCDIPREWIILIEPKITRLEGHWYWNGTLDKGRHPMLFMRETKSLTAAKRWIMHLFFDFDDRHSWVYNGPGNVCREQLCVHPKHLVVSDQHYTQIDWDKW